MQLQPSRVLVTRENTKDRQREYHDMAFALLKTLAFPQILSHLNDTTVYYEILFASFNNV